MSNIILRRYQTEAKKDVNRLFKTKKVVVMAMCPGSGKTVTALKMAEETKGKVLVLAHGTTIIKSQWLLRAQEYGVDLSDIQITLPQSIKNNKDLKEVELLIVDEAHEFYYAEMVQKLIKKTKPKRILLLTGTPSKFIRKKAPVVLVSADKLISEGFLSNVYFSNVSSKDSLLDADYNAAKDVKASVEHRSVEADLDSMLKHMIFRLKATISKDKPMLNKLSGWTPVLGSLHKTLIACRNIKQARRVKAYFDKNTTLKTALSESEGDRDSLEVDRFIENPKIKLLIVVRRGILGFDLSELVNVIDLTGSRNIDRIYQLMARVMRKNETHAMKYFFKIAPPGEATLSEFYLRAAISMVHHNFVSKFNGKNLSKIGIPFASKKGKKRDKKDPDKKKIPKGAGVINPELFEYVESVTELIQLYNKADGNFNEISYITLNRLKFERGETSTIQNITKENLEYMIKTGEVDRRIYG